MTTINLLRTPPTVLELLQAFDEIMRGPGQTTSQVTWRAKVAAARALLDRARHAGMLRVGYLPPPTHFSYRCMDLFTPPKEPTMNTIEQEYVIGKLKAYARLSSSGDAGEIMPHEDINRLENFIAELEDRLPKPLTLAEAVELLRDAMQYIRANVAPKGPHMHDPMRLAIANALLRVPK